MANVAALIKKTKELKQASDAQLCMAFSRLWETLPKVISFNNIWENKDIARGLFVEPYMNVVEHSDMRLMLGHGEMVKFSHPYGVSFIAIGTHFGIVVMYSNGFGHTRSTPRYMTTKSFIDAWNRGYSTNVAQTGNVNDRNAPHFFHPNFLSHVDELAELERKDGRVVNDGMPTFPKKPRPQQQKHAQRKSQQVMKKFIEAEETAA